MTSAEDLLANLAEEVAPSSWQDTFRRVPRHHFVPDRIWIGDGDDETALDRADAPDAWLRACYADQPVITQIDDGSSSGRGYRSSSASMPSVVATMLVATDLSPGQRVLEIGTGTGWNAALLADRAGAGNVTSVEIDPGIAAQADRALEGRGVRVVLGDGEKGYPPDAPYDRVLATAAVQRVPYPWVEQTVPGGRIVTPWGTSFHNGTLLRLRVDEDGTTASGRFGGNAGFMWVRGQRTPHGSLEERVRPDHEFAETVTDLHPYEPVGDFDASFAIGLRVPGMKDLLVFDDDVPGNPRYTVYLMDPGSGSWASWRISPGPHEYPVRQHGPRHLFDELAAAYTWWQEVGRPEHSRFGVTITREGQRVWLDEPGNGLTTAEPGTEQSDDRSG